MVIFPILRLNFPPKLLNADLVLWGHFNFVSLKPEMYPQYFSAYRNLLRILFLFFSPFQTFRNKIIIRTQRTQPSCMHAKSLQMFPTLCDLIDCSPPVSSVHGILQARILEWSACPPLRDLLNPGIELVYRASPALQLDSLSLSHWVGPQHS